MNLVAVNSNNMHEGEEDVLPNDEHIASMALHTQSLKVQVLET